MTSFEELLKLIEDKTKINHEKLIEKVEKKYEELSGLITKEGAAYLVARELGLTLPSVVHRLQIKNILPGMRNVNVIGRIFKISPINEFERANGSKGKVVNLFVGDETGYARLPLWNDQVKLVEDGDINLGDTIQIVNGLARENIFGNIEISIGKYGNIHLVDADLPSVDELTKKFLTFTPEEVKIKNIAPGRFKLKATIAQIFKGEYLFKICPICGMPLDGNVCSEHGEVEPELALVISVILDDGTGTLRAVCFREVAEKLIGMSANELGKMTREERYRRLKAILLGREMYFIGRVRKNKRFDRLEILVDEFKDLNVSEESKKLVEDLSEMIEHG